MRAASAFLFALTLYAQDPSRGVNFYSIEKEKALGEQLAGEYRRSATIIESPELLQRIEALGSELVPAGSRYSYTFALADDDDILLNEPPAFPGGYIFVPSGLILTAQNGDELAGMIAHAIAHVEARHGTRQATKAQMVNQAAIPLIYMGGWTGFATRQNLSLAIPLGMLKSIRASQLDADLLGARLMSSNGYSPQRLADYIERVQAPDQDPPDARSPLPPRAERVAALRALPAPAATAPPPFDLGEAQELLRRALPEKPKAPPHLRR